MVALNWLTGLLKNMAWTYSSVQRYEVVQYTIILELKTVFFSACNLCTYESGDKFKTFTVCITAETDLTEHF